MADTETTRRLVAAFWAAMQANDWAAAAALFVDDYMLHWPQSGEQILGGDNRRGVYGAFPQLPTVTPRRLLAVGDLVVAEAALDYGGPVFLAVFIFEFRDGRIARETAYWSEPFEAPQWRAEWVQLAEPPGRG